MAEFDGSIYAYVGADIDDYQAAMNKITTATQRAFEKAQEDSEPLQIEVTEKLIGKMKSALS